MLSGSDDSLQLARCLREGAEAVIGKDEPVEAILEAITSALAGHRVRANERVARLMELQEREMQRQRQMSVFADLSRREREVLDLLLDGLNAASIAERRFVSLATVRSQIKSILTKLGARSQLEAVAIAYSNGYRAA